MPQQIQLRRDSAADWTSNNPTLASGEVGVETDTGKIKIGDGTTAWTSLAYFGGTGAVDSVNSQTGVVVLDADDINDAATTNKFATAAQLTAVDGLGTLAAQDDIAVPGDITATGTASSSTFLRGDGTWATPAGGGGGDLLAANNLSDLASAATARTNLGLGTAATTAASAYQPVDSDLTAIAALTTTSYGRALLTAANLAALQGILGTTGTPSATTYLRGDGSWSTPAGGGTTIEVVGTNGSGTWDARGASDLAIWAAGTDTAATTPAGATGDDIIILAEDADLTAIAALTTTAFGRGLLELANAAALVSAAGLDADLATFSVPASTTISTFGASLIDDAAASNARTTLGLGTIATQASSSVSITGGSVSGITDLAVADGGTGASTAQAANANLRVATSTVTGTTDTLDAGDDARINIYSNAAAVTVTLANLTVGHETVLVSTGAGGLSVAAGGMTLLGSPNLTIAQGESLFVKQTAASTWIVLGGTAT